MGLYDLITCEYPLPLPDLSEEDLKDIEGGQGQEEGLNWGEIEWQTKSLEGALDFYSIEEDGQIYSRNIRWVLDPEKPMGMAGVNGELSKYEGTSEIKFFGILMGEKNDYFFEFKAIVYKGNLEEIELIEHLKEDNTERKEQQKEMLIALGKVKAKGGAVREAYRYCIEKIFGAVRFFAGLVVHGSFKIERWLK